MKADWPRCQLTHLDKYGVRPDGDKDVQSGICVAARVVHGDGRVDDRARGGEEKEAAAHSSLPLMAGRIGAGYLQMQGERAAQEV